MLFRVSRWPAPSMPFVFTTTRLAATSCRHAAAKGASADVTNLARATKIWRHAKP